MKRVCLCCALVFVPLIAGAGAKPIDGAGNQPFGIRIVDEATGRAVPLVELELVNHSRYISDSAGWIAFKEPGLIELPRVLPCAQPWL